MLVYLYNTKNAFYVSVNMAWGDLIAVKKNVKNSKKTSPLAKVTYSADSKIGDLVMEQVSHVSVGVLILKLISCPYFFVNREGKKWYLRLSKRHLRNGGNGHCTL